MPLDDIYMNLIEKIPALTRYNLYICLKRARKGSEWPKLPELHSFCQEAFSIVKYITRYDKIIEYYDSDSSKFNFNQTLNRGIN
jgi:hypothetical protein